MSISSFLPARWDYQYLMHDIWDKYADARVQPFMPGGPETFAYIIFAYLAFVLYFGPNYMRNRKPFELRNTILVYNAINVLLNGAFFVHAMHQTNWSVDCWGCRDGVHTSEQRYSRGILYAWLKIYDLLDTVFFVLRKKDRQVTPLHVSHHVIMPFTCYIGVKFVPNTTTLLTVIANSFVHTAMYAYYFVAAQGTHIKKFLWFKQYMTIIQLVQFALVGTHAAHLLLMPTCDYPRWISTLELAESVYFMYTFVIFYRKTYLKKTIDRKFDVNCNEAARENLLAASKILKNS